MECGTDADGKNFSAEVDSIFQLFLVDLNFPAIKLMTKKFRKMSQTTLDMRHLYP